MKNPNNGEFPQPDILKMGLEGEDGMEDTLERQTGNNHIKSSTKSKVKPRKHVENHI